MDCSTPGFPVHQQLLELAQTHFHQIGNAINHLILCCPLLFLPSIFPSIRVFSNESVLCIRWPKYWNFSFSISPSNEYSGLISFRIAWFGLLAVQVIIMVTIKYNLILMLSLVKPNVFPVFWTKEMQIRMEIKNLVYFSDSVSHIDYSTSWYLIS